MILPPKHGNFPLITIQLKPSPFFSLKQHNKIQTKNQPKKNQGAGQPEIHRLFSDNLTDIHFAARIEVCHSLVVQMNWNKLPGDAITFVVQVIEKHIN